MENIKELPLLERPREKLIDQGAGALDDEELLAVLLGSGTPKYPLNSICSSLMWYGLAAIAQMDLKALCAFKGIGPAKAAILLAAAEYCRRAQSNRQLLKDERACCAYLRPILAQQTQLQYILLLISPGRELLAFSEAGSVLPDIVYITALAMEAGAGRLLLARNGWPAFSNTESRYLSELRAACVALGIVCNGLMAVGPERFKMM
jgi:DNA repair protein RadC